MKRANIILNDGRSANVKITKKGMAIYVEWPLSWERHSVVSRGTICIVFGLLTMVHFLWFSQSIPDVNCSAINVSMD